MRRRVWTDAQGVATRHAAKARRGERIATGAAPPRNDREWGRFVKRPYGVQCGECGRTGVAGASPRPAKALVGAAVGKQEKRKGE